MSISPLKRPLLAATIAVVAAVGVVGGPASPASSATEPDPKPYVTGWLPYWNSAGSAKTVANNADVFQNASPFVFHANSAQSIVLTDDPDEWRQMLAALRKAGVPVIPTVATDLTAEEFAAILSNPARRAAHVDALAAVANRWDVRGLDLDYETINFGSEAAKRTVRRLYPVLVDELEARLQKAGRRLSVTVASRTSWDDPNWWVFAYKDLGAQADRIRLMTYDYHWGGGSPGPIAPKWWVEDVVQFATSVIDPAKISVGMPAYGRDWFGKTLAGSCPAVARETVSRTSADMEAFAASKGITPVWRDRATSKTFTYTRTYSVGGKWCRAQRVVWYDDARSLGAKVPLVETYGLRGIALWALGNEGSGSWSTIRQFGRQIAAG